MQECSKRSVNLMSENPFINIMESWFIFFIIFFISFLSIQFQGPFIVFQIKCWNYKILRIFKPVLKNFSLLWVYPEKKTFKTKLLFSSSCHLKEALCTNNILVQDHSKINLQVNSLSIFKFISPLIISTDLVNCLFLQIFSQLRFLR